MFLPVSFINMSENRLQYRPKRPLEDPPPVLGKRIALQPLSDANAHPIRVESESGDVISNEEPSTETPPMTHFIHIQYLQCFNLAFEVALGTNLTTSASTSIPSSKSSTAACTLGSGRATDCAGKPSTSKTSPIGMN